MNISLECPKCGNHYPSDRHSSCTVCDVPLINMAAQNQNIKRGKIQAIQAKNITGTVINQTMDASTPIARYKNEESGYTTTENIRRGGLASFLAAIMCAAIEYHDVITSVINLFNANETISNFMHGLIWVVMIAFIIAGSYFFYQYYNLAINGKLRDVSSFLYELVANGFVKISRTTAKCPISGCSGDLVLNAPKKNKQDIKLAGICNKKPTLHIFDFDDCTLQGGMLNLDFSL